MLAPVDFDDEPRTVRNEIHDVRTEMDLPPKVGTKRRFQITEMPPKFFFGVGRLLPH